ncbi:MAG: SAM-dependent DNA methyltransferase [Dechloromonas sp.]|uniref:site-specific DNA-methyltransferase (adenine-specific) n=1 Tax=Candidatus Dechloromonas phosphorivorans TaxID=2899244 RepID=A0A935JVN3_9RHOO|nr:SAM-dependent DNA methyltransferase [Candidatus Dechloromonas phosphorivorans]
MKEIDFISFTLDQLAEGGRFACIVPMSVAIKTDKNKSLLEKKRKILSKHRLDAVFSMPNDLFYPVSTNTCIMVFTAYTKHREDYETFFGYLKDDGFKVTRKGRIDQGRWTDIKKEFIRLFVNGKMLPGKSVCKAVTADEEWCAEAYMETDFSDIKEVISLRQ